MVAVYVCGVFLTFFHSPAQAVSLSFTGGENVPSLRVFEVSVCLFVKKKKASGICMQTLMSHLKYSQRCTSEISSYKKKYDGREQADPKGLFSKHRMG